MAYTFNTGNPVGPNGSADPRDLVDNAQVADRLITSTLLTVPDRLGVQRRTWAGMENKFESDQSSREQEFRTFIASSGYQFVGDYAAGIEITQYNQLVRDSNGEFWRVSGQEDLPYLTTGSGLPEGGTLVPVGDAVLRQDLTDPNKGAAMVTYSPNADNADAISVAEYLDRNSELKPEFFGAKADYLLPDGSINPNPTDNHPAFVAMFNSVNARRGNRVRMGAGHYFLSQPLTIIYQTQNFWKKSFGIEVLSIEGAGVGSTSLVFPSSCLDGIVVNRGIRVITNVKLSGFSVIRQGFNANEYTARPFHEDFDFTSEPKFGVGVELTHSGYLGGVHDLYISGFYCGLRVTQNYNSSISRIFMPPEKAIYGYLGTDNTNINIKESNFWGYQACFASNRGQNHLSGIIAEGNFAAFKKDPGLVIKFSGHSYWQTGSLLKMDNCYTEKCIGYARGLVDVNYYEVNGIVSNGLGWAMGQPESVGELPDELKSAILAKNSELLAVYYKTTENGKYSGTIENSRTDHIDGYIWIEVPSSDSNPSKYTDSFTMKGSLISYQGFEETISRIFKNKVPANLSISNNRSPGLNYSTVSSPVTVDGIARVHQPYYARDLGYDIFNLRRDVETNKFVEASMKINRYLERMELTARSSVDGVVTANPVFAFAPSGALTTYKDFIPDTTDLLNIGSASRKFNDIYAVNGTIVTSDGRKKTDLRDLLLQEKEVALELKRNLKAYRWIDSKSLKGDDARWHFGVVAQEVAQIFADNGLDAHDYALFCYDEWEELPEIKEPILDDDGNETGDFEIIQEYRPAGNRYGIRYDQLLAFIIGAL